ncbi:MAG: hypothetical protein IPP14_06720 [Planctomycetes bacterium]|nr:hypothetical protein [Planctomycetota bacterium]
MNDNRAIQIVVDLTGQEPPFPCHIDDFEEKAQGLLATTGIGYSQFNEMLLYLGYDRISEEFFAFLLSGGTEPSEAVQAPPTAFVSVSQLRLAVEKFRILAIVEHGNIKYGFKLYSNPANKALVELLDAEPLTEEHYVRRHRELLATDPIASEETYNLGYVIERELADLLKHAPDDSQLKKREDTRKRIVEVGKRNQKAYLTSDHMDVYVATSMRERHEYRAVASTIANLRSHDDLTQLKVRFFDPTQAYCHDRIDKGLAEGLMLKRAKCTLYLAQESDTLGKDSELACTLAQGKPVIAFVPSIPDGGEAAFVRQMLGVDGYNQPDASYAETVLKQLRAVLPDIAWTNKSLRQLIDHNPATVNPDDLLGLFGKELKTHYDRRAKLLKEVHPLGLQVDLESGVANGVLVARSISECAKLIRRILLGQLEFVLEHKDTEVGRYFFLRESTTQSIFRVVTGDAFLTNAFWNFYLAK